MPNIQSLNCHKSISCQHSQIKLCGINQSGFHPSIRTQHVNMYSAITSTIKNFYMQHVKFSWCFTATKGILVYCRIYRKDSWLVTWWIPCAGVVHHRFVVIRQILWSNCRINLKIALSTCSKDVSNWNMVHVLTYNTTDVGLWTYFKCTYRITQTIT